MKKTFKTIALLLVASFISVNASAQEQKAPASPPATATGKIKDATITINYSSPAVKGRTIWGGLEKYDKVWRAGANKTTTFETDKDITVQGKKLPAGKYNFFLIPKESGTWTAIFNKEVSNTNPFNYKEAEDQLRVDVKTKPLKETQERLVYKVNKADFALEWDKISVPIAVK
ncbi:MAG: DUF2911 domain-containing protein [Pedobacter sp.]|nr:MAG: DUF2911 domain-containing protein [Pedobacter sp.]